MDFFFLKRKNLNVGTLTGFRCTEKCMLVEILKLQSPWPYNWLTNLYISKIIALKGGDMPLSEKESQSFEKTRHMQPQIKHNLHNLNFSLYAFLWDMHIRVYWCHNYVFKNTLICSVELGVAKYVRHSICVQCTYEFVNLD